MNWATSIRERGRNRRAFTLVELLVVVVVLAVLAAIVLPKFMDSGKRSKESALKSDLALLRNAVSLFQQDTDLYPKSLDDLAATAAPAKGLDSAGLEKSIDATLWHGPYIQSVPTDPISGGALSYNVTSGSVGKVSSAATGYEAL